MKALVLSSLFLFAVVGTVMAQTPTDNTYPDFSYLDKTTPDSLNQPSTLSYGKYDAMAPYDIPQSVKDVFVEKIRKLWNSKVRYAVDINHYSPEEAKASFGENKFLRDNYRSIVRVDLPADFGGKQLFVWRLQENIGFSLYCDYFFLFFDPKTGKCSGRLKALIYAKDFLVVDAGDLLGNGRSQIAVKNELRIGNNGRTVIRYYEANEDLSIKEAFAYETEVYMDGPVTVREPFDKNSKVWQEKIKKFDANKTEEGFEAYEGSN